ncbi:MAG: ferritin-like domain-containing protein [Sphingomonadales bacterium]|nr:MAG: ferritin-like domain-containing protein [Sphingomonadales bacterium]
MLDEVSKTTVSRRSLIGKGSVLTTGALLALANMAAPAYAKGKGGSANANDVDLLNAAIGLEHEGIAAYDIALGSGLIPADALDLVRSFQGHHKQHRDELAAAVRRMGGTPVESKLLDDYVVSLNAKAITSLADIQRLALRLERGAATAYIGLIAPLKNHELHTVVARLAADEALHATAFMFDLKETIPTQAKIFG